MFSIARRKRNQVLNSMLLASTQDSPPRSMTTTPHPPPCSRRSVVFSACSSPFHGFPLLPTLRTWGGGLDSRSDGKDRGGRKPRRGSSRSRSTCSPAQRATTWICAGFADAVWLPTREGMALSTPRINSRGCRQPCTGIGFLPAGSRPRVFLTSLSADAKYEDVLRSGPWSPVSPHRTQSNRGSSTPAAAKETGSSESETSTNAQASCRSVACASKEKARLVRPEEAGPHNSTSDPRGKPPPSTASSSVTPLGWSSTEARFWNPSSPLPMRPVSSFPGFRERAIIAVSIFVFCSPTLILIRRGKVVKGSGGSSWSVSC